MSTLNETIVDDVQGTILANLNKTFWYDPSQSNITHTVLFVTATTGTFSVGSGTKVDNVIDFWYKINAENTSIEFKFCTKTDTWNRNFYVNVKYPTIAAQNIVKTVNLQIFQSAEYMFSRNGVAMDPLFRVVFAENPLPTGFNSTLYANRTDFYGVMQNSIKNLAVTE